MGRAIALAFSRQGAKVGIASRRLDKIQEVARAIEEQGGQALAIACDVTKARDAERAVHETATRFGQLNILINNAGALHVSTIESIPGPGHERQS